MNTLGIQTLRGLACCLLLFYHIIGATPLQGLRVSEGWLRDLTEVLAVVRMPVFGLIAGAMYGFSSQRGWKLVKNKASRLLLPMLSVGTIFAVAQYLTPGSNARIEDLQLLHIVPVAHYWFLESLFLIFCMLAVAELVLPINSLLNWCVYFVSSVWVYSTQPGIIWFSVLGAFYLLPYFLLGLACSRLRWDPQQQRQGVGVMLTIVGSALAVGLLVLGLHQDRFSIPMLATGLIISTGLWSLGWRNTWLARIGNYSFAIFLFHSFFTSATRMGLQAWLPESQLLVMAVSFPIGIVMPIALQHLILRSAWAGTILMGHKSGKVES